MTTSLISVDVPGAFECFFTGSGCYAGDLYSDNPDEQRGCEELREAWMSAQHLKRGKGVTIRLNLSSLEAAVVLVEYAEACLTSNADEPDYSEVAAARKVMERVEQATDGRVAYNGWYVTRDGAKIT